MAFIRQLLTILGGKNDSRTQIELFIISGGGRREKAIVCIHIF
jgi:hypothetical protein